MAIELSNLTFTEQDDVVPTSGVEEIFNNGIANTFAGNDIITGENTYFTGEDPYFGPNILNAGIRNQFGGIINTGDGNDTITGIYNELNGDPFPGFGIFSIEATIDTGNGDDIITGISGTSISPGFGIQYDGSTINTGDGNDVITGIVQGTGGRGITNGYTTID